MKTHEFAKALSQMARVLRKLPNRPLDEMEDVMSASPSKNNAEIAVSLTMLASLSSFGKVAQIP